MAKAICDNFAQIVALTMKVLAVGSCTVFQNIVEERQYHIQLYRFENRSILPFLLERELSHKLRLQRKSN